ncbi:MAG: hypothetical protein ACAH88_10800 [Roseimicrobium sp.]
MDEEKPKDSEEDPIRTCAYSGERRPESQMVRIGEHFVAVEHKDAAVQFLHQGNEFDPRGTDMQAPPVRLGPLISKSWEIFRQHWLLIALIDLTVALPLSIFEGFVTDKVDPVENAVRLAMFSMALNGVFTSVGHAAVFAAVSRIWGGKAPTYRGAWFLTMARLGNVVLASVFVLVLVIAGMLLCLVPGILASVWLAFTLCVVMDEDRGAWLAIERSAKLAQGRFWTILGYILAVTIPLLVPVFLYGVATEFVPVLNHWVLDAVLLTLVSIPLLFSSVFTFVLYKALCSAPIPVR